MTTASKITMTRIFMIPFFIACAMLNFKGHEYVALAIFIVSACTDWLDGYVARHYNQVSTFGKFVDPLADKLLVTAALLIFVERGQMASWICWIVVAREFAVSGLRLVAMESGTVIAAAMSGKDSMVVSVSGNDERILLTSVFDNLGKGASGAALECLNLVMGREKGFGLDL